MNPGSITNLQRREIQASISVCLLREFISVFGYDPAVDVASAAIRSDAMETGKKLAEKYGGNSIQDLLRVIRDIWVEEDALEFTLLEETDQKLNFNVTRCRYAELYDRLGIKEFGYCFSCNRDAPLISGFNTRMRLVRNQTIMQGADICDFRIILE